jgi:hypothetical protein
MLGSTRCDIELPPPLMTSELGSFARRTIVERKPQIIRQVIEDNDYTLGVAIHSVDLAHLKLGQTVAVLGAGPIGLLTAAVQRRLVPARSI